MMMNTENLANDCEFRATAMSYVYRELSEEEIARFEGHLAACDACIAEMAEISIPHFAVHEWKTVEFEPLPTPAFVLPQRNAVIGWLEALRRLVSLPNGGLVAAGSLAVAAFVFLAAAFYLLPGDANVARVDEQISNPTPYISVAPSGSAGTSETSSTTEVVRAEPPAATVRAAVVSTASRTPSPVRRSAAPKVARKSDAELRAPTVAVTPRLSDVADAEVDNTLRLADLLADVGSGD